MSAKIFAVIFCIALRTYFDEEQNNEEQNNYNTFSSTLNYYEEIYFSKKGISDDDYQGACKNIFEKLTTISLVGFLKKAEYTHKYSHLVHIWGEEKKQADVKDILMPIIVKDRDIQLNNRNLSDLCLNDLFSLGITQTENQNNAYQSDENNFIDLMVRSSIKLWSETSNENVPEASS